MDAPRPRPSWLLRNGVWVRRSLMGAIVAMLCVGKAVGVPNNSPTARYGFFIALGLGCVCLLLYAVEYLLAVRYRGYWFDHDFD